MPFFSYQTKENSNLSSSANYDITTGASHIAYSKPSNFKELPLITMKVKAQEKGSSVSGKRVSLIRTKPKCGRAKGYVVYAGEEPFVFLPIAFKGMSAG